MRGAQFKWFLFMIGLLAQIRVHLVGMIGISEILICLAAPFLLVKNWARIMHDGFGRIILLLVLTCFGCIVSSWYNHTPYVFFIRGIATPIVFLCAVVFFHDVFRKNLNAFVWVSAGLVLSYPLSFVVNGLDAEELVAGAALAAGNEDYMVTVMTAPLFALPIICFYKRAPLWVSISILMASGVYKVLVSESGRSAALVSFAAAVLVYVGGKSVFKMAKVRKYFIPFLIGGIISVFVLKSAYSYSASTGLLGERAQQKFYLQTQGKTGFLNILIGGRSEAFICIYAALDKPIIGHGPWAMDDQDYGVRFMQKFDLYDYEAEESRRRTARLSGLSSCKVEPIPFHSAIFGNWVWYGISGLLLWIYILCLIFRFYRYAPDAIPQWWGVLSLTLPRLLWDIFFSPFGSRVGTGATVCALLIAIGVSRGRINMNNVDLIERLYFFRKR